MRRYDSSNPNLPGGWRDLALSVIGNAAARETFVTATPHMAAMWTDLFHSLIVPHSQLRWRGDGPGVGRDARIAYSSLLGRYLARAYLTEYEGVRVLVPLDVAKRQFEGTPYVIRKAPPGRGLEADWIGLDDSGLVIVEAKGSFDTGIKPWRGQSRPQILQTAIDQARRTAVFERYPRRKLPAKRWAIASRWGTEENNREPTLLAWDPEEEELDKEDYRALERILLRADLGEILEGLGHGEILPWIDGGSETPEDLLDARALSERIPGDLRLRLGNQVIGPGFAAMVSPFGVSPLRNANDLLQVNRIRALSPNIAVASLSSRYVRAVIQDFFRSNETVERSVGERSVGERFANRAGLTVIWPEEGAPGLRVE